MKKLLSIVLAFAMLLSLCACNKTSTSSDLSSTFEEIVYVEEEIDENATVTGVITNSDGDTIVIFSDGSQVNMGKNTNIENTDDLIGTTVSEVENKTGVQISNGNNTESNNSNNNSTTKAENSKTENNSNNSSSDKNNGNTSNTTNSSSNNNSNNNSSTGNSSIAGNSGTTVNNGVNPEDYRGITIKFASTIDPKTDGTQYVLDAFKAAYGIDVKIISCSLENYVAEMQGLMAAGASPDVGRSNGDFPACLGYFQSLDAAKLDYEDEIWNQKTFELSTFDGSPYMCDTYGNYWAEQDIVVYSKSKLKRAGCYTPEEYAASGNWTWDAFVEIARACTQTMGMPAGSVISYDSGLNMLGGNVFKIQNGKITNGIDSNTATAMRKFASAWNENIFNWKSTQGIIDGTTAITTAHAWSLRKDGDLKNANWADIGFYYLPACEKGGTTPSTGIFRGWGIIKGANNPVAGGLFLRWYLDVNNYDTSKAFISPEAQTFFFRVTSNFGDEYNPYLTYLGLNERISGIDYSAEVYKTMYLHPAMISANMMSVKATVDSGTKRLNDFIQMNASMR